MRFNVLTIARFPPNRQPATTFHRRGKKRTTLLGLKILEIPRTRAKLAEQKMSPPSNFRGFLELVLRRAALALLLVFASSPTTSGQTAPTPAPPAPAPDTGSASPPPISSSHDPSVTRMEEVVVEGRQDVLTGLADSATQGTIGSDELSNRPIQRTGEILETVPGVIITQHAGGGKANQYFTRGFNLDHGTDFSTDLDGMPLNLPTHAHGQGYADLNIVIPELIDRIDFEKGPYFPSNGDFSTVGAAHLVFANTLPSHTLKVEEGDDRYERVVYAGSNPVASGNLLEGFEAYHENGPWVVPDDYKRYNGVLKYSQGNASRGYSVMAMAYHGQWNSTDQVSASAVASGLIPFYGSQSPTDGGYSQRYSLQAEWHRQDSASAINIMAYAFHYDMNLFSNFTYYLESPDGDQFEQQDNRSVAGLKASDNLKGKFLGRRMENTFGAQLQTSWIDVGLYQTVDKVRTNKVDYDGNLIPAATKVDAVTEISGGLYYENQVWWTDKFRSEVGLRENIYNVDVRDCDPVNSGDRTASLASPKLSLIFGPWDKTEIYLQGGYGFHSNDARTDTATVNPDNSVVGVHLPVLVPSRGTEIGVRTTTVTKLQSTLSLWYLHDDSELYFNGISADSGETSASQQATHRYGIEFSNYYTPMAGLTFDLDYADSWAHFDSPTTADEDVTPGGTLVDEAIHQSLAAGVTVNGSGGWESTLRVRYFGPRPLVSDGSVMSKSTLIVNLGLGYRINKTWRLTGEVLNLLNRHDHDIDYYYQSKNSPKPGSPAPNEDHFHAVEPIGFHLGFEAKL
jgi:outer membrane receptor protein involved in Fe transport